MQQHYMRALGVWPSGPDLTIAAALHLSEGTVRNYLSAAMRKVGARNRSEAVDLATRKGWL